MSTTFHALPVDAWFRFTRPGGEPYGPACRKRGAFEYVIGENTWKHTCSPASPAIECAVGMTVRCVAKVMQLFKYQGRDYVVIPGTPGTVLATTAYSLGAQPYANCLVAWDAALPLGSGDDAAPRPIQQPTA